MDVFVDCRCKKCKHPIQIWFDSDEQKLFGTECKNCGAKLSESEYEMVFHACDTLVSMKDHVKTFKISRVHFIGRQRAERSGQ